MTVFGTAQNSVKQPDEQLYLREREPNKSGGVVGAVYPASRYAMKSSEPETAPVPPSFGRSLIAFVLSTTGVSALLMMMQAGY
jgi:hypothetical protein